MRFLKFFLILVCFLIVSGQVSAQPKSAFSVLSFNTSALMPGDERLRDVAGLVIKEDADFVYLTEEYTSDLEGMMGPDSGHYGYCESARSHVDVTERFFSRYPIADVTEVGVVENGDAWVHRVRVVPSAGDTLSVYCCHLPHEVDERVRIVRALGAAMGGSPERTVVAGDMNSLVLSRPMLMMHELGLGNAWDEVGSGRSATFYLYGIGIRIDHIWHSPDLRPVAARVVPASGLSDHNALLAEFAR